MQPSFEQAGRSEADRGRLSRWIELLERTVGLARSVLIYYGQPFRHRQLVRFYSQFIQRGDLCFDLGAHLGNRTRAWLELGARVVAVEPLPVCMRWLHRWFGDREAVALVEMAVGAEAGRQRLWVSRMNPTVSTISSAWLSTVGESPGFSRVRWQESIEVGVTTLDALIAEHGEPAYCKLDVEGAELDALTACSSPIKSLSFEFVPAKIETALGCVDRLQELGAYEFQYGLGEPPELRAQGWLSPGAIRDILRAMTPGTVAGDVYARLKT